MRANQIATTALQLAALLFVGACTLDSGGAGGSAGTGTAGIGSGGFGGFMDGGGFGGSSGSTGGFGGFMPDGGQACGRCPEPVNPFPGIVTSCCTPEGTCGGSSSFFTGCQPINAPGFVTQACPDATLIGMKLAGCCRLDGLCGWILSPVGLGCVERSTVADVSFVEFDRSEGTTISCAVPDSGVDDAGEPECSQWQRRSCDPLATCVVEAGSAICECPPGYADFSSAGQRGAACRDVNECLLSTSCPGARCVNTPGSFVCETISE